MNISTLTHLCEDLFRFFASPNMIERDSEGFRKGGVDRLLVRWRIQRRIDDDVATEAQEFGNLVE